MANNALHKVVEQAKTSRRRNRWNKVVTCMAAFVVFCTTYALILPAITEEREPLCGLEEHVHTEACWELPKVITCPYQQKAENGQLPLLVHTHDELCYDTEGNLICSLPEVESHVHDYRCYTEMVPEKPHIHTEECFAEETVLNCTLEEAQGHVHGDGCVFGQPQLICEIPEGHVHGDTCLDENGSLVCEIPENHVHETVCYSEPVCELPESEGHTHGDSCYTMEKKRICGKEQASEEELAAYIGEPQQILTCGREEIILHQHTAECRDEAGSLICGMEELFAHQHGKECLSTTRDPEAEKVLVCGFEEHTHDDTCYTDLEADLETPEMWEANLPELTDIWAEDLLAVAVSQLGYEESTANVTVTPEGEIQGYTRYGQWAGTPYGPWSLTFLDFCQHYAGIPEDAFPVHEGQPRWCQQLQEENWNIYWTPDQYTPVPGDTVFFDLDVDGNLDAAAIVWELTEATEETEAHLTVIQGDVENSVQKTEYNPQDPVILGYGSLAAARERWDILNPPPAPEPVRYCGLGEHTHMEGCFDEEQNLICELAEHIHSDGCLVPPVVYHCGQEEHIHDENCYDNEGTLICTHPEHTHEALCQVENKLYCTLPEHIHTEECYDENSVLTCGFEAHTHGETCWLSQQTIEAQLIEPLGELSWEITEGTAVTITGILPGGATITAAPADVEGLVFAFDITLYDANGNVFQPEVPVQVDMKVPGITDDPERDLKACHVSFTVDESEEGSKIICDTPELLVTEKTETGDLTTTVPHFSLVGAKDARAPVVNGPDESLMDCPAGCALDDYLKPENWVPCTDVNPFGTAQQFNLFLLGDMNNWMVVHGNAAIMGKITEMNSGICYDDGSSQNYAADKTEHFPIGLVLGGYNQATTLVTVKNGTVITQDPNKAPGVPYDGTEDFHAQIDMDRLDTDHNHIATADQLNAFFEKAKGDPDTAKDSLLYRNKFTYDYCMSLNDPSNDPEGHKGRVDFLSKEDWPVHKIDAGFCVEDLNGKDAKTSCDIILEGDNDFYNVFNVPASMLQAKTTGDFPQRVVYLAVPFGSYTIINVYDDIDDGKNEIPDFLPQLKYQDSDGKWIQQPAKHSMANYTQTQRTLMNFDPSIEKVSIGKTTGAYVYASILGPNVDLEVPSGSQVNLHGTIVLENLHDIPGKSAIINNPFMVGSRLGIKKDTVCDEKEPECPITLEDHSENNWKGYYADVTLESINDSSGTSGSSETIVLKLPSLDLDNTELILDATTPGKYMVSVEHVYRKLSEDLTVEIENQTGFYFVKQEQTDEGGNKTWVTTYYNRDGTPVASGFPADSEKDPIFAGHSLNRATFGTYSGSTLTDGGNLVLEVTPGMIGQVLITNHYEVEQTQSYTVQKTWWEHGSYIDENGIERPLDFEITPPDGAFVKIQLWRTGPGENGKPVTERVPEKEAGHDTQGNLLPNEIILNADDNWTFTWVGLPDRVPNQKMESWSYTAKESYCYDGFTHDPEEDSLISSNGVHTFFNWRKKAAPDTLEVKKLWYDEKGEVMDGGDPKHPASLKVGLYSQTGTKWDKQEGVNYPKLTVIMDGYTVLDKKPFFNGSTINLNIKFWYDSLFPYDGDLSHRPNFTVTNGSTAIPFIYSTEKTFATWPYSWPKEFAVPSMLAIELKNLFTDTVIHINMVEEADKDYSVIYEIPNGYQGTVYAPDAGFYEQAPDRYTTWSDFTPVLDSTGQPITKTLSNAPLASEVEGVNLEPWEYIFANLPKTDNNGNRLRYFVFEDLDSVTGDYPDYKATYIVQGRPYPNATPDAPNGVPGMTEGYITIENRPIIGGPELPMTGGIGTTPYTLGGLLASFAALFLLKYKVKMRRKEDKGD